MIDHHSKGEWVWEEDPTSPGYFPIKSEHGTNICMMQERNSDMGMRADPERTETIANARLVCAAPKMLAALEGMLDMYTAMINSGDCGNWNPENDPEVIAAREAVKAARLVVL